MQDVMLESILICPVCGHAHEEVMPIESCMFFFKCRKCETLLKPNAGDCCVFCSFGNVPCPPIQAGECCS